MDQAIPDSDRRLQQEKWGDLRSSWYETLDKIFRETCGEHTAQYFSAERDEALMLKILEKHKR